MKFVAGGDRHGAVCLFTTRPKQRLADHQNFNMEDVEAASSGGGAGPAIVTPGDSAVRVYKIVVMGDGSSGKVR